MRAQLVSQLVSHPVSQLVSQLVSHPRRLGVPVLAALFVVAAPGARAQTGWYAQFPPVSGPLRGVDFRGADAGWIAGPSGTVLRTTNAGADWIAVESDALYNLNAVSFGSETVGVAVGEGGTILRTTDGGTTWLVVRTDWLDVLRDIRMFDASTGIAVGANPIFQPFVAKTTDSGASWDFASFYINGSEGGLFGIDFVDASTWFAAATLFDGTGSVVRSTNGGTGWTPVLASGSGCLDLDVASSSVIVAVTATGTCARSTNGGAGWSFRATGAGGALRGVAFGDGAVGVAVGDGGRIVRTEDAGFSWVTQSSGAIEDLFGVYVVDPWIGTVAGENQTVLHTVTGGETGSDVDDPPVDSDPVDSDPARLFVVSPNPIVASTEIRFTGSFATSTRLLVLDSSGRVLQSLARSRSAHPWTWDGRDARGHRLPAGSYWILPEGAPIPTARRVVLLNP